MICPSCETQIQKPGAACPVCGQGLSSLVRLGELPDYYFNYALEACKAKDWLSAVEALSVTIVLNPSDAGAFVLLGKVYIELNLSQKASSCFIRAYKIDARNKEAQAALQWLSTQGCKIPLDALLK